MPSIRLGATFAALFFRCSLSACGRSRCNHRRRRRARQRGRRQSTGPAFGRTYSEQRHSPLAAINDGRRSSKLGIAWYLDLPKDRSLTGTPLAVDGVLYFNGSYNVVRAVEAKTGKLLWEYDPKVTEHTGDRLRMMWDWNRGIAFWKGRVYNATIDGRLIAIDARTGKEVWTVQTFDPKKPLIVTGAPKVFRDKVIIGNGGTEWGPARGFVTAYDTETGEHGLALLHRTGQPGRRLREQRHEDGRQDLDRGMVGARRRRHRVARHHLRPGVQPRVSRHRQRLAVEPQDPLARGRRQPVPVLDRGARRRHRRVQVALPDRARRDLGLQLQHGHRADRSRGARPAGPGRRARPRSSCTRPRTASSTSSIAPTASCSRPSPTPRSTGRRTST